MFDFHFDLLINVSMFFLNVYGTARSSFVVGKEEARCVLKYMQYHVKILKMNNKVLC